MGGFVQPFDAGGLDALLGLPGQPPGQLPGGIVGQTPQIDPLFQNNRAPINDPPEEAPLEKLLNLDQDEERRRQREEAASAYVAETPEKRAQRKWEELVGKPGERTKQQKVKLFANIVGPLLAGGPPVKDRLRAEAEQEYAKVAPTMKGELATISAERRAEAQRIETARVKDEALKEKQREFDDKQQQVRDKADLQTYFQEGHLDIAQRMATGRLKAIDAKAEYDEARTKLVDRQTESLEQAIKAGPRANQMRAELMTLDEMTSKGLDPENLENFEKKRELFARNLKMITEAQTTRNARSAATKYMPRKQGYDPKTFEPVFITFDKQGGPPIISKITGAPHKGYIIPTDKARDEVFAYKNVENRYQNVIENVIKNPDVLGLKNIQGSEFQAVTGQLTLPQLKAIQSQVQAISEYVKAQSGVQYGFRELQWLKQVFPTLLAKDPKLYVHGLANLYSGVIAMRMMKQYGLTPDHVDLPKAMDEYADHMLAQIGKNPNTIMVPSAKAILTRAADAKGYVIIWEDDQPMEVRKK